MRHASGNESSSEPQKLRAPLGPSRSASGGFRFRLHSANAEAVELCLFRQEGNEQRFQLRRVEDSIWQVEVPSAKVGDCYGYRVYGPFAPGSGHWFNPSKLLVDPYARALTGEPANHEALSGIRPTSGSASLEPEPTDSAPWMPKAILLGEHSLPDFTDTQTEVAPPRPNIPWRDTVIYEAHVRGLSLRHPEVPEKKRGTFLGVSSPAIVRHLQRLGITTLELMPICQFSSEKHLLTQGRRNYWGYSPLAFFAPHSGYASVPGRQVAEVRQMVLELHQAGIEVILDMVFNHTAEGGTHGTFLSLKGIDNRSYYLLDSERPENYVDYTGCGNTLDIRLPATRRLVMDSLRYWAVEIGVDGFRLDLAPTLARDADGLTQEAWFFQAIAADPILSGLKWIAEPWDLGPEGYRLGKFPPGFAEWNDRFRNTARRFWRGEANPAMAGDFALRLAGSPDVFGPRSPYASVNYLCSHDGFTLTDLNTFDHKHNLGNGEGNRDGTDANFSNNWGVEGPTDDPSVLARRNRAIANQVATWALAAGVPLLSHGDELGRTQRGNNNAYCQDNELTWLDWENIDQERLESLRWLLQIRRNWQVLRSEARWRAPHESGKGPVANFFGASGESVSLWEWSQGSAETAFGLWLDPADDCNEGILALFNGGAEPINLSFPERLLDRRLTLLLYSAWPKTPRSSALGLSNWTLDRLTTVVFTVGPLLRFAVGSGWP